MVIVGSFILPHGSLIFEPDKLNKESEKLAAKRLNKAMIQCSKKINELKPDIILLTTPHSISLDNNFGIYLNKKASGSAEWEGNYSNYNIEIKLDQNLSKKLLLHLQQEHSNVSGITCFSPSVGTAPLRWAEVVPLWFLRKLKETKYIILSQPMRRYKPLIMKDELLALGYNLNDFFDNLSLRVVVIVSADLAHTHGDGMHYKFSDKAEIFDQAIENWAKTLDINFLLNDAGSVYDESHCCGFTGFLILQGLLENLDVKKEVLSREKITYFGMIVTSFL